jgi:hypothetical protein
MTISTFNMSSVKVYVNGTLNQTFSGNSTNTLNLYALHETRFDINVTLQFTNGTRKSLLFNGLADDVPMNFVVKKMPTFAAIYQVNGYNISASMWSNFTKKIDVYVNSVFNQTVSGNLSTTLHFNNLGVGAYNITLKVYNSTSLYNSVSNLVNVAAPVVNYVSLPSVTIEYPSVIYGTQPMNMTISTEFSSGFWTSIYRNGTIQGVPSFYAGNITISIPIPTGFAPSNLTFKFNIDDARGHSWKNVSISTLVLNIPQIIEMLTVSYDSFVFINQTITISGTSSLEIRARILFNSVVHYDHSNVTAFSSSFDQTGSATTINASISVYFISSLIYYRNIAVVVLPPVNATSTMPPSPSNPFLTLTVSSWTYIFVAIAIGAGIAVAYIFVEYRQKSRRNPGRTLKLSDDGKRATDLQRRMNLARSKSRDGTTPGKKKLAAKKPSGTGKKSTTAGKRTPGKRSPASVSQKYRNKK